MSLLLTEDEKDLWRGVLERRFIAAAQTEDEYAHAARRAHALAISWLESKTTIKGSFLWVCDALDIEPSAVKRALTEKAALPSLSDSI